MAGVASWKQLIIFWGIVFSICCIYFFHYPPFEIAGSFEVSDLEESSSCDVTAFKNYVYNVAALNLTVSRQYIRSCDGLIYNKVPKCGSLGMKRVFQIAARKDKFGAANWFRSSYTINPSARLQFLLEIGKIQHPFVLLNHHYFYDINRFTGQQLLYINIIREPFALFRSQFSYRKYDLSAAKVRLNKWNPDYRKLLIGECIQNGTCAIQLINNFCAVRFLCGHDAVCENPQSAGALRLAKRHLAEVYLVVGITEDLNAFVETLQILLPHMFQTLLKVKLRQNEVAHATTMREDIPDQLRPQLEAMLRYEIELYEYGKQKFYELYRTIKSSH